MSKNPTVDLDTRDPLLGRREEYGDMFYESISKELFRRGCHLVPTSFHSKGFLSSLFCSYVDYFSLQNRGNVL